MVRRRLRDRELTRLHHKVYLVGPGQPSQKGHWLAAVLGAGRGALLARTNAAALWEIARSRGSRIDVLVPAHRNPKLNGVRVHRSRRIHPDDISLVDSIPVTSVERTLCDLAAVLRYADLKRAFEQAERRRLIDHRKLREAVERMNGTQGAAIMRRLLGYDPRPATETRSELEVAFLELVTGAGLPPYQRNVSVHGYDVDAYWPEANLVVELQSYTWHSDPEAFERDHAKLANLRLAGFEVHAFTHRQVTSEGGSIVDALSGITDTPGVSRTPLEVVREQYDAVNESDWDRSIALWSEDVVLDVRVHGIRAGVVEGREAVTKWFVEWFTTFDEGAHFELNELEELEDGTILGVSTHRARGRGSGVPITGEVVWRYFVEDGHIVRQIGHESREAAIAAAEAG